LKDPAVSENQQASVAQRRVNTDTETPHEPMGPKALISVAVALKDIGVAAPADDPPLQPG
jgi:hypothetical protein